MVIQRNIMRFIAIFFVLSGLMFCVGLQQGIAQSISKIVVPEFSKFFINEKNYAVVMGKTSPDVKVELLQGARKLGEAQSDAQGSFTITFNKRLARGQYRFVLRAIEHGKLSVTSPQTVTVLIFGAGNDLMIALLQDPAEPPKIISDTNHFIRHNQNVEDDFNIHRINYQNHRLSIDGRGPSDFLVMVSLGDTRIGSEKIDALGNFKFSRSLTMMPGDMIIRLEYINIKGETVQTIDIPFFHRQQNKNIYQVYQDDRQVRTVKVKKGDSLSKMAQKIYGNSRLDEKIFLANRNVLKHKNQIVIGQELIIPSIDQVQ
ncbi:LysM peptidoglycan-binding domain-containing protein [Bartonella tamiae]|uniref:LysM domain-containing protein n=1 Tax=Bartonella tamiae Th239 TaxID=1094558 RepID=J0ZPW4_9HYPH|nr:LysM peptidoglycan-binding domain-containing protein [Bartonella tamiae]EJF90648.1 hypothetical protein ME5_01049 [Bartonella tamiae Th239]EJF93975.1 hypothetical protein MEG_00833 [Bartonella tamiae Th307]